MGQATSTAALDVPGMVLVSPARPAKLDAEQQRSAERVARVSTLSLRTPAALRRLPFDTEAGTHTAMRVLQLWLATSGRECAARSETLASRMVHVEALAARALQVALGERRAVCGAWASVARAVESTARQVAALEAKLAAVTQLLARVQRHTGAL